MKPKLPDHEPYVDKYFLRAKEILQKDDLNPYIRAQVFIRKGPGTVQGLDEAIDLIGQYSPFVKNGGRLYALRDGDDYAPNETLMVLEGRVQDLIEFETIYLGIISEQTTKANGGQDINVHEVADNARAVVAAAQGRPVLYMGARHWHYSEDAAIAAAAFHGGFSEASTDAGAATAGKQGIGTIPHALECIYAWKYGLENAVVEATKAFDRHIDSAVPRIALIDYANKEVDDAVATADALEGRLAAVRVDTCGENIMQGGRESLPSYLGGNGYWGGKGVSITGVQAVRQALDDAGHDDVKIVLSSGFGKVEKIEAFNDAERVLGVQLYDSLGVGGLYDARMATMDIVAVGDDRDSLEPMSKVGRLYRPNYRLERVLGGE